MPSRVRRRSFARLLLVTVALCFALVIAALLIKPLLTTFVARQVRQRVEAIAGRAGVTVTLGRIELGLAPLLTIRNVAVNIADTAVAGKTPLADVDRITADLSVRAAIGSVLRGETPRPERVDFYGLRGQLRLQDGRSRLAQQLLHRWRTSGSRRVKQKKTVKRQITLRIHDGQLRLHITGKGRQWLGPWLDIEQIDVDVGRDGGSVAATLRGAVTGRVHTWLRRDEDGRQLHTSQPNTAPWTLRAEAGPELTWRPPSSPSKSIAASLGLQQVRLQGITWRGGQLELRRLRLSSAVGALRIARLRTDRRGRDIRLDSVHVRLLPSMLQQSLVAARLITTDIAQLPASIAAVAATAELRLSAKLIRAFDIRGALAGGGGEVVVRDGVVAWPRLSLRASLDYGRLRRAPLLSAQARPLQVLLVQPEMRIGDLKTVALPPRIVWIRGLLARFERLWNTAHRARRTVRNGAGWARPKASAAVPLTRKQRRAARRLRHERRRANRGKPAFTAQFAEPVRRLPERLQTISKMVGNLAAQAARHAAKYAANVEVRDGSFSIQAGAVTLGSDRINALWSSAHGGGQLSLRPRLGAAAGGSLELSLTTTASGQLQADLSLGGSGLARMISGLDTRLAVGASPDIQLHATWLAGDRGGRIRGRISARDMGIDWDRFAPGPVTDLSIDAPFELRWPADLRGLTLQTGHILFGGTARPERGRVTVAVRLSGGKRPILDFKFGLPSQDCGALLAALPPAMLPTLGQISAEGSLSAWLDLRFDVAHPYYSELDFGLDDKKCRNIRLKDVNVAQFNDDFSRRVNEDGTLLNHVRIGPLSDAWVDFGALPPWVPYAMITTEDGGFWRHRGLNAFLLNRAIRLDLHYGRFVYGGSTITQQLAKNLFFTRSKFLARKLEELLAVWAMERGLKKVRIIEIYMNAVEFAPHIYGVVRGAMHYFGKQPSRLSPLEAAWLGSIKPCPRCGESAFQHRQYRTWYQIRLLEILTRMHRNNVITDAQFEAEANTVPGFVEWPAEKLNRRFSHPIPEKKPAALRRLDRRHGTRRNTRRSTR